MIIGFESPKAFAERPSERPNILMIYLDDFGWRDTGFMGSDFYETPTLDQLSVASMVFTNAYSGASNCAPARACLLSGQYSPRHRIFNVGTRPRGKSKHRRLEHVMGTNTLDPKIRTWAHQLQAVGYRTATIGKWHLSKDPLPYGFDVNIGGTHSGSPPQGYYPPHRNAPGLEQAPPDEYLTDRLSNEAVDFIRQNAERPWMLYLTHFAVHTPLNAKKELVEKYAAKQAGKLHHHVKMATMIEAVDQGVARILAELERLNLRKKTVIIFYSDNGGIGSATDMAPLRGYKGTYYEGGIRVPCFVNWPSKIKPGENETLITGVDFFPTLCELGDAEMPENQAADGESIVPLLLERKNELRQRAIFWHFPTYLQTTAINDEQRDPVFRTRPCGAIRKGDWKLIHFFEDNGLELYNLRTDIGEKDNRAEANPEKAAELKRELAQWQREIKAPIPVKLNPEFDAKADRLARQRRLRSFQDRQ